MLSQLGRVPADSSAEGQAPRRRRAGPSHLGLEALEPRLLLDSGGDSRSAPPPPAAFVGPLPAPAVDVESDDVASEPAPGHYVVVPETPAFHGTIATAQPLPDAPFVGVAGTIGATGTMDVYRVPPSSGTLILRLASRAAGADAGMRLTLLDAQGHILGDLAAAGTIDLALDLRRIGEDGVPVFVAVASAGAPAAPAAGYQLWVLRQAAAPPPAPVDLTTTTSPLSGPIAVVPLTTSASAWSSVAALEAGSGTAAVAPAGLGVGTAALAPTLSAAPAGGLLAEGSPTVRAEGSGVDRGLDLVEVPARFSALGSADLADEFDAIRRPGAAATLVAVRESGGAPMLGAGSIGDWRRTTSPALAASIPCHPTGPPRPITAIAALALPAAAVATSARLTRDRSSRPTSTAGPRLAAALTVYALGVDRAMLLDLAGRRPEAERAPKRRRPAYDTRSPG
jgi:hypothetical protein